MNLELACCLLATAAALFYIFTPGKLFVGQKKTRASYLRERKDAVYENLRDLNFEFRAGKYSEKDYEEIKQSLEIEAARVLADMDTLTGSTPTPATRQAAERPRNS